MTPLFTDQNNNTIYSEDIYRAIKEIGAHDCDYLFIHSDITFGKINHELKRSNLLNSLYDIFDKIGISKLVVPTFTYSFCNNEDYNIEKSPTSMGAFNEFIRKKNNRFRTSDPLLSVSVHESKKDLFCMTGNHSLGKNSAFDIIHNLNGVKFLFFGAEMGNCFTYLHYIEKMLDVEYRFDQPFTGKIIYPDGKTIETTQFIHTACFGVKPADFYYFQNELENDGFLRTYSVGNKKVSCIDENTAYIKIIEKIRNNINYFLEKPYTKQDLIHKYTKGNDGHRITHC